MRGQKQKNKGMHGLQRMEDGKPLYPRKVGPSHGRKLRKLRLSRGQRH